MGISERKQREFLRREREILDAALALFNAPAWQSVTIDQIAREAEIGKGTVYKHFASKDEIYARLAIDFYADMLNRLNEVPHEQPVLDQLRQWIRIAWMCHRRGREYHRLVSYCHRDDFRRGLSETTRGAFERLEADFYQPLTALLAQGVAGGVIADLPLARLANLLRAAFEGGAMLIWHPCMQDEDPERFIDDYTAFMIAALTHFGPAEDADDAQPTGDKV